MIKPLLLFGSAIIAVALVPKQAEACSCYSPGEGFIAPKPNQTGVPTNTKIWSGDAYGATSVELFDNNDQLVGTVETKIQGVDSTIRVLTPIAPLQRGMRYTVQDSLRGEVSNFVVEVEADILAPDVPTERGRQELAEGGGFQLFGGSSCGNEGTYRVMVELDHQGVLAVADIAGQSSLDSEKLTGNVTTFDFGSGQGFNLGSGVCGSNWVGAKEGDDSTLRYGTFDLAGNFSGWSDETTLESPNKGCTCVVGPRSNSHLIFGIGLLLFGLRVLTGRRAKTARSRD